MSEIILFAIWMLLICLLLFLRSLIIKSESRKPESTDSILDGIEARRILRMAQKKHHKSITLILIVVYLAAMPTLAQQTHADKAKPQAVNTKSNNETTAPTVPEMPERERLLLERIEQLERRLAKVEASVAATHNTKADATTLKPTTETVMPAKREDGQATGTSPSAALQAQMQNQLLAVSAKLEKREPFAFADFTWLTGNPRTKESPLKRQSLPENFAQTLPIINRLIAPQITPLAGRVRSSVQAKSNSHNSVLAAISITRMCAADC